MMDKEENGRTPGKQKDQGQGFRRNLHAGPSPYQMEVDPRSSVSEHFKAALHRIDGIVMCIAVAIYLITAMVFLLRIILLDAHTERDEMIMAGALCMVLATILLYFKYDITLVIENVKLKRLVIAMLLLGFLVYFFYLFFVK